MGFHDGGRSRAELDDDGGRHPGLYLKPRLPDYTSGLTANAGNLQEFRPLTSGSTWSARWPSRDECCLVTSEPGYATLGLSQPLLRATQ